MITRMMERFLEGAADLAEDAHQLLLQIEAGEPGPSAAKADCRPPLDVLETAGALEVVVDVPGVRAQSLRVALRRGALLVVGHKPPGPYYTNARFHVAERSYGRFARVVRLGGAFDATRSRAVLAAGQLRITLPLLNGCQSLFSIPVEDA